MVINFLNTSLTLTRYQHQQQMSISLDATAYAIVYSVLVLHDAPSLLSLIVWGWLDVHTSDLSHGRSREVDVGTLAASTASVVRAIRWCGPYNFYFTENIFYPGYRHVRVIRICGVYAQKYGIITVCFVFCKYVADKKIKWPSFLWPPCVFAYSYYSFMYHIWHQMIRSPPRRISECFM